MIWDEVMKKLDTFLGDTLDPDSEDAELTYPETLRILGWNWAQRMLCNHTPLAKQAPLRIDTGGREGILPPDIYSLEGILDTANSRWWWPMHRAPGNIHYDDDVVLEFWQWGDRVFLESEVEYLANQLTVYYWAYYPEVTYEMVDGELDVRQDDIIIPQWAEAALVHLTTAHCFQPGSVLAGNINQWDISVDSGTPMMNPRAAQAKEHLWWYHAILSKFPPAVQRTRGT